MNRIDSDRPTASGRSLLERLLNSQKLTSWLLTITMLVFLMGNTPLKKPVYAVVIMAYLLLNFSNLKSLGSVASKSLSMVLLLTLVIASYFWSVVPSATLDVIISQSVFVAFALCISVRHQLGEFDKPLRKAAMILIGLVALHLAMNPSGIISGDGAKAFFIHKNLFGATMAICALVLFHAQTPTRIHYVFGLIAVTLLAISLSKTSITLFILSNILLVFASMWCRHFYKISSQILVTHAIRTILWITALIALISIVIFSDEIFDILWLAIPKDLFSGRGALWIAVLQQIRAHTLLGIGPGALWQAGGASEIVQTTLYQKDPYWMQRMISSDGTYIDLMASFGFLGIALFLLTVMDLYRRLFRNWHRKDSSLIFVMVTFILFHAITESTILYSTNILWLIYLICYFRVAGYSVNQGTSNHDQTKVT